MKRKTYKTFRRPIKGASRPEEEEKFTDSGG